MLCIQHNSDFKETPLTVKYIYLKLFYHYNVPDVYNFFCLCVCACQYQLKTQLWSQRSRSCVYYDLELLILLYRLKKLNLYGLCSCIIEKSFAISVAYNFKITYLHTGGVVGVMLLWLIICHNISSNIRSSSTGIFMRLPPVFVCSYVTGHYVRPLPPLVRLVWKC